jgi:outer membrane receptor protein involved in Fe transport
MANSLGNPETRSYEFSVKFVNNLSSKSYFNVMFSRFLTGQSIRTRDPWDGHPLGKDEFTDSRFSPRPSSIQSGGLGITPMFITTTWQEDEVITNSFKGDFTSQVNSYNLIKFGAEFKWHNVLYDYYGFASGGNEYTSYYDETPLQLGIYAQDKIETDGMIVNVGLRYDYFDPRTVVPYDLADPLNPGYDNVNDPLYTEVDDLDARLKNSVGAETQQQLSPRVGISYPITEKDVLHVTYGHYFQLPVFDDLYYNHAYDLRGAFVYVGNPNLERQKTIAYEAGIEHGFNDYLKLSIVGFYKDIADLTSNRKFNNPVTGVPYWVNLNSDYARVKGFEVSVTQRPWNNLSGMASYSYQSARGRASDPEQTFLDDYRNRVPRTGDSPLDWDQPHTAKANLNYSIPASKGTIMGDWGIDFVWTYGSGRPYTGITSTVPPNLPPINDERFPAAWSIDLRVDKGFAMFKNIGFNTFVEIRNLTDRADIVTPFDAPGGLTMDVQRYSDTGDPSGQLVDPRWYSPSRRILLGAQFTF